MKSDRKCEYVEWRTFGAGHRTVPMSQREDTADTEGFLELVQEEQKGYGLHTNLLLTQQFVLCQRHHILRVSTQKPEPPWLSFYEDKTPTQMFRWSELQRRTFTVSGLFYTHRCATKQKHVCMHRVCDLKRGCPEDKSRPLEIWRRQEGWRLPLIQRGPLSCYLTIEATQTQF